MTASTLCGAVICLIGAQAETHIQRLVHPALVLGSDLAGPLPQAVFIQCAYLLQQHDAVLGEARIFGRMLMWWEAGLCPAGM